MTTDTKPVPLRTPAEMLAALGKPFPRECISHRKGGGGKDLSYYQGHTIIHRLNDATGGNWSFSILREWTETEASGRVIHITHGCLTIPGLGAREQFGVQLIAPNGGEDMYKGGPTDCLKKCASLFGVGLELYGPDFEDTGSAPAAQATHAPSGVRGPDPKQTAAPTEDRAALKAAGDAFAKEAYTAGYDTLGENGEPKIGPTVNLAKVLMGHDAVSAVTVGLFTGASKHLADIIANGEALP